MTDPPDMNKTMASNPEVDSSAPTGPCTTSFAEADKESTRHQSHRAAENFTTATKQSEQQGTTSNPATRSDTSRLIIAHVHEDSEYMSPWKCKMPIEKEYSQELFRKVLPLWDFVNEPSDEALDTVESMLFDIAPDSAWPDAKTKATLVRSMFHGYLNHALEEYGYSIRLPAHDVSKHHERLYHEPDVVPRRLPDWLLLDHFIVMGAIHPDDLGEEVWEME
ncbi:hypothetical protein P171DRAFT_292721 [Karstenula rhodostoma CBS 690.94]|uniref:Uncharacterized protein n=1 Tax=Karstenula rhodostoma CBS 690.94 TaxID=1392251 RepID=A0A9P4PHU6_9PLEO|nr:hypothetical protein P171DRAFT_292721 [Karstenula rhodostoma CBS 690.94]